jgi:hypothetical protein
MACRAKLVTCGSSQQQVRNKVQARVGSRHPSTLPTATLPPPHTHPQSLPRTLWLLMTSKRPSQARTIISSFSHSVASMICRADTKHRTRVKRHVTPHTKRSAAQATIPVVRRAGGGAGGAYLRHGGHHGQPRGARLERHVADGAGHCQPAQHAALGNEAPCTARGRTGTGEEAGSPTQHQHIRGEGAEGVCVLGGGAPYLRSRCARFRRGGWLCGPRSGLRRCRHGTG